MSQAAQPKVLGSFQRFREINDILQAAWEDQFSEKLTPGRLQSEQAVRDVLGRLEKKVFGEARERNNDAFQRAKELANELNL